MLIHLVTLSSGFLAHQFQPGANWRGNALGRPKGSRNKLAEAFIADVYADWLEHGSPCWQLGGKATSL